MNQKINEPKKLKDYIMYEDNSLIPINTTSINLKKCSTYIDENLLFRNTNLGKWEIDYDNNEVIQPLISISRFNSFDSINEMDPQLLQNEIQRTRVLYKINMMKSSVK